MKLREVMESQRLNWRSFGDQGAINTAWNLTMTPGYYVIDHRGVIRYKWLGYPGREAIDTALEDLIEEAQAGPADSD